MTGRVWWTTLLLACATPREGMNPGECEDGADNDGDGTYDCRDDDCAGAPACDDGDDTPPDTDDAPDTDDTIQPDDPNCTTDAGFDPDQDADDDRPPGPHTLEIGRLTAWQLVVDSYRRDLSAACSNPDDPDWAPLMELSDRPRSGLHYTFLGVDEGCDTATRYTCPSAEAFPQGCDPDPAVSYTLDDHTWTGTADAIEEGLDPLLAPGCTITIDQVPRINDDGADGTLTYTRTIETSGGCPQKVSSFDGCVVTFTYNLTFAATE